MIEPPTVNVCAIYINTPVAILNELRKNDKKAIRIPLPIITIATATIAIIFHAKKKSD